MEHQPAMAAVDGRIAEIAGRQHGVVARRELVALGMGAGAIHYRMRAGRLHPLHRGVYAVGHRRLSHEGRWIAAVLACGHGAALSYINAAAHRGLRQTASAAIHVSIPTDAGRSRRQGIVVHRCPGLRAEEVEIHDGIATTTVARTLVDIAGMLAAGPLERAVEQALALRLFDLRSVQAVLMGNATRPGVSTLAAIVARIHDEPQLTRSELENMFLELCARHAIPRPQVNAEVAGYTVDFCWPAERLVVETDGNEHHGTRVAFERDRARDARLTVAGQRVLRFTHRQLVREPVAVAEVLLALLAPQRQPASEARRIEVARRAL